MSNREKLKQLFANYLGAELKYQKEYTTETQQASNTAEVALYDFLEELVLDPVLETYEDAAKRMGWKMDYHSISYSKFHNDTDDSKIRVDLHTYEYDREERFRGLCEQIGTTRQIVDPYIVSKKRNQK